MKNFSRNATPPPGPPQRDPAGLHVAIIMDGNGRWARERGWPREAGHRAGADAVERTVEAAPKAGAGTLTLYAFSSDNWNRPAAEVSALMGLLRTYLREQTARCVQNGVRINVIGRRDRLARPLVSLIEEAERRTSACRRLLVRIAIDYSSRDAILRAASLAAARAPLTREAFAAHLAEATHSSTIPVPDVDLLIRTGGEQRLSDFLLWECAYAELYFTPRKWPDFEAADLEAAIREFRRRERRFGGVPETKAV